MAMSFPPGLGSGLWGSVGRVPPQKVRWKGSRRGFLSVVGPEPHRLPFTRQ